MKAQLFSFFFLKKTALILISIFITQSSCNRTPDVPPVINNKPVSVFFNNAYKGLVSENQQIAKKDPNNPDKMLVKLIESAKEKIDLAVYDIQNIDISKSIVKAKKRGVKIRVVTDTDNLNENDQIRPAIKELKDAGIEIKDDKRSPFMHNKFFVVDGKIVWTGSLNLTTNSLYDHNNNSVMINSENLAANFTAEFDRYFEKGLFAKNPHEIPYPQVTLPGEITVQTFFSPEGGTKSAILKEIKSAQKSIRFMAFAYTDKDCANLMIEKYKQKVAVEGVFDSCQIGTYSVFNTLKSSKIPVYRDGNQALMHHKTIIMDDKTVITGSFNFSVSAEKENNENTLIINSQEIANIYTNEYQRIKYAALNNKDLPPYDHPACKNTDNPAYK